MLDNMPSREGSINSNGGGGAVVDSNEGEKRVYKMVLTGGKYPRHFKPLSRLKAWEFKVNIRKIDAPLHVPFHATR